MAPVVAYDTNSFATHPGIMIEGSAAQAPQILAARDVINAVEATLVCADLI